MSDTIQEEMRQSSTTEAAPVKEAVLQEEQLSPKFAALARKEKALRNQLTQLKSREDAMKAREQEYETNYIPRAKLKSDPLGILTQEGVSYEELTNAILNQNPQDQFFKKLEQKIQELEGKLTQQDTKMSDAQKQSYEQAVNQIRRDTKTLVDSDPNFETIKETNSHEAVVTLITETFDKEGTLLSLEDAAKEVEDYLLEEALKMTKLKKIQQKMNPEKTEETVSVSHKVFPKTLTNATTANATKPLTQKDRYQRAVLAFQGKLTN